MAMYANQKTIQLGHLYDILSRPGSTEPFLQATRWQPLKSALRNLNGNAFKLWFYLLSWDGNGVYEFSPAHLAKELGISDEGARNARNELINKGYIIEGEGNRMEFFPVSRTLG